MTPPKHLWSGDWRHESELARQEAERQERLVAPPRQQESAPTAFQAPAAPRGGRPDPVDEPPANPPSGHRGRIIAAAVVAVLIVGGGIYAASTLFSSGDSAQEASTGQALPAITGKPIPKKTGQTLAAAIYAKASPAVVSIRTSSGSGTGFVIDRKGTIVTNAHVVTGSKTVQIQFGDHGAPLQGTVKGIDPSVDLAVVDIPDGDVPSGLKPLALADSRAVTVGDDVIAIGNPFGLNRTETTGIVSGIARDIPAPNGFQISEAIQTDASINPGNSGGPLLDATGTVVGVNSQIETSGTSSGSVGVGFAVPSNAVRQAVPALAKGRTIDHAFLGVSVGEVASGGGGALIGSITPGGPAQGSSLQVGDIVTKIDGKSITDASALTQTVNSDHAGQRITLTVRRGGKTQDIQVTLTKRPATATKSP